MDEITAAWLEYANADLETASFLYEKQHPRQLEIICYHCQQAAEKAIKALYVALDIAGGIPRKHDLSFLLQQISGNVRVPESINNSAIELDPYGIIVRYPGDDRVDDALAKRAIEQAKAIMEWAKGNITQIDPTEG